LARGKVAVVGAGVMGLATARALARAGVDVVVHEQFGVGDPRASSYGRSRVYRLAYPDPHWVQFAQEAVAGWRRLEAEAGETILQENGMIEVVHDLEQSSTAALGACGVQCERLEPREAERRFPIRVPPGSIAVVQPDAGFVRADRALAAFARGVKIHVRTRVDSPDELDAEVVVVTAGPWVNRLADPPLDVKVTSETVAYFHIEDPRPVPSVITFKPDGPHDVYALADPLHGIKAGCHFCGPEVDPDEPRTPDAATVDHIAEIVSSIFPSADAEPVDAEACLYTTTPDESFVLERRGRVVIGSACSGHAFKFAPAVGERLAKLVLEALD
jgi:sarcosine oxidase